MAVTSNKFNLAQEGNFVSLNITDLSASPSQSEAAVRFALNQSGVVEGSIANISSHALCTNATPELLDTVPSIDAICGRCCKLHGTVYYLATLTCVIMINTYRSVELRIEIRSISSSNHYSFIGVSSRCGNTSGTS